MIKVLIVDDSPTARELLRHILSSDRDIHVVGVAVDGAEAVRVVQAQAPDAITMDINMPRLDGLQATRTIMETRPTPIIIVSTLIPSEETATFRAIEAGALAVIRRPVGPGHPEYAEYAHELITTVKNMAEVKLVKRWPVVQRRLEAPVPTGRGAGVSVSRPQLLVMGGSTGAPGVFERILKALPRNLGVPIAIVQHITAGFAAGFAEWLGDSTGLPTELARQHHPLLPGHVYVAPDGYHLTVTTGWATELTLDPPENGMRPSICRLFRSAAYCYAERAIGVLLSGMGADGAQALKVMRDAGAVTLVQDPESAVISSMPEEAIRCGGATHVLSPPGIASILQELLSQSSVSRPQK